MTAITFHDFSSTELKGSWMGDLLLFGVIEGVDLY